jgi:tRNA threonylcarbamoyladenosine biosynthesis protein TsaE
VLLSGDLGAGKTHLTKGIARGMNVRGEVTSPTFNLVMVHEGRMPLYHVDLYRLDAAEQLEGIGYFDAIEADGAAVVEWGDRFAEAIPAEHLLVTLHVEDDTTRRYDVRAAGERGRALAGSWIRACEGIDGLEFGSVAPKGEVRR